MRLSPTVLVLRIPNSVALSQEPLDLDDKSFPNLGDMVGLGEELQNLETV